MISSFRLRKEVRRDDRQAFKSDDFDSCASERAFKTLSLGFQID